MKYLLKTTTEKFTTFFPQTWHPVAANLCINFCSSFFCMLKFLCNVKGEKIMNVIVMTQLIKLAKFICWKVNRKTSQLTSNTKTPEPSPMLSSKHKMGVRTRKNMSEKMKIKSYENVLTQIHPDHNQKVEKLLEAWNCALWLMPLIWN